ncbi:BTB and MATH domain-containing protein 38-like isoform X2 [Littorina saxatilis]|uniref:BTB domain-containing protein n=1 Tax=Littorina saxatilis TaxID=31220 RepID=A0AAN9GPI0_9CAEN
MSKKSAGKRAKVSVFETEEDVSDVTFVVDGRELHFCKSFLKASSPVFNRMFSSDFTEKDKRVIPLPGKKIKQMDVFLQQLHPVHCWKQIPDSLLDPILSLADEYQVEHIRRKSETYIGAQITVNAIEIQTASQDQSCEALDSDRNEFTSGSGDREATARVFSSTKLSTDQVLLYLRLCIKYKLANIRPQLIRAASGRAVYALVNNPNYKLLPVETQRDLLKARCLWLETGSLC